MRFVLTSILIFVFLHAQAQFKGLIVNEFSQGNTGSREYIELLVVGKRTCRDSTADIRGWIIDDQNGWYGTTNGADGHYRLRDIPQWSAIPFGSIILLYNSASGQKNLSIMAADDPTDANKDHNYILPINSSAYLEEHDNEPTNTSGPGYAYPLATSTAGYNGTSNTWIAHIALNNTGGDVLSVMSRNKRDSAFFSIGYGYAINAGFRPPTVTIADVGGGNSVGLLDSNYLMASRWSIAPVPSFETPGAPNGGINTTWIQMMRTQAEPLVTLTTACSNGPYLFFGQTITASGPYRVLTNNANGCTDTNDLYVVIKQFDVIDTTGCDSLIYKGTKYISNTTIVDNIKSVVIDCDSLVRTVNIRIKKSSSSLTRICMQSGQSYVFNAQTITSSGIYSHTLTNFNNCDSIARLQIVFQTQRSDTIRSCSPVIFNGITYSSSATVLDTIRSLMVASCDSITRRTHIQINSAQSSFITNCTIEGTAYSFNGQLLTATGLYKDTLQTAGGCDSIVNLYIVFKRVVTQNFVGCDSVSFNGTTYYQPATINDTTRSVISGCDSIINSRNIILYRSTRTFITDCSSTGTYNFFGQTITSGGFYTHTIVSNARCDSTIQLYLVVVQKQSQNLVGCNSLVFKGTTYTSSTVVFDTVRSLISNCDSIITTVNIQIVTKPDLRVSRDTTICKGDTATLTASSAIGNINWIGFGNVNSIRVSPVSTTIYTVIVSNGNSCADTTSVIVTVEDFSLNIFSSLNNILPATPVTIQTSGSLPYSVFAWEPAIIFPVQDLKTQRIVADSSLNLYVIAQSSAGCKDTAYLSIVITPLDDIYVPSGFTPNGDGKNDVIRVVGEGIKEIDFKIFNRWGQLIFATKEKGKSWDGTLAGKLQPADTYVYVAKIKMNNGQPKEKKGTVTLIR
jgi:gliding motility-associated-like protein